MVRAFSVAAWPAFKISTPPLPVYLVRGYIGAGPAGWRYSVPGGNIPARGPAWISIYKDLARLA